MLSLAKTLDRWEQENQRGDPQKTGLLKSHGDSVGDYCYQGLEKAGEKIHFAHLGLQCEWRHPGSEPSRSNFPASQPAEAITASERIQ